MPKTPLFSDEILIFDGAVGTELYQRGFFINRPFEELNLSAPDEVKKVHEEYIRAGAQVITTNTFAATRPQLKNFDIQDRQADILRAALRVANEATQNTNARVGFSLGPMGDLLEPLGRIGLDEAQEEFRFTARVACESGKFDLYILETFSNLDELKAAINGIRKVDNEHPILASIAVKSGQTAILDRFALEVGNDPRVQALGINCSEGPSDLLKALKYLAPLTEKPIVVQPNAGLPRHVNGRYFYMTSPDYLGKFARRFIEEGAMGVGGCCGTGPDHIRAIQNTFSMMSAKHSPSSKAAKASPSQIEVLAKERPSFKERPLSKIGQALQAGKRVISIEVLPPKGTDLSKFLAGLEQIEKAGVEFVNVPDGARASTRVGSLHLAAAVAHQKRKITVLPHFTTRDRNLIALQSDLLGAFVNGVSDILLVTGDPPKLGTNRDATGVYDIDSIGLTYLADCLNRGVSPTGDVLGRGTQFGIGVATNPTAVNLDLELERWRYKFESGADFAVTQPIFEPETYLRWREKLGDKYKPHIVGIWPLISLRNAEFMANEVPGILVPQWVIDEMAKAGDDSAEATKRGVAIARSVMEKLNSACEGFCISAPVGKVSVALEVLR